MITTQDDGTQDDDDRGDVWGAGCPRRNTFTCSFSFRRVFGVLVLCDDESGLGVGTKSPTPPLVCISVGDDYLMTIIVGDDGSHRFVLDVFWGFGRNYG